MMGKIFGGIIAQFQEFYKSLGPTKRNALIASVFIGFFTLGTVVFMASGKDYAVLLKDIPGDQLTVIINKLMTKNVPYRIKEDTNTILVPRELLYATQMQLMAEVGSSRVGSIGLELFDKQDFGINSYAQKINYQRALQGELVRAINTLSSVKQSKVILALPAKKTILEESNPPSASVVVELHPGKELSAEQVRGIRYLVMNSVEGMDIDHVSVIDEHGKMLSRAGDSAGGASNEMMEIKQKIEKDLEGRIESILSKVVGVGKVIARVDATINQKMVTSVEEIVDPEKTAIRSQTSQEESLDGARTSPTGVPGSRSNIPGAEDNSGGQVGFKQDVKKELKTVNFEVPKTVKNIKEAAGGIEKLSVAVLLDGISSTVPNKDGQPEIKWVPRSAEEIVKYDSLVKNAIGFTAQRGDKVSIESIQFQPEDFGETEKILTTLEKKRLVQSIIKWSLLAVSLLLFFFMVVRPFMQWITDSFSDSVEEMLPRTIEELEELNSVDNTLPGMGVMLPMMQESVDPEKAESELLKDRIMTLMQKDEEKATSAIAMWLARKD